MLTFGEHFVMTAESKISCQTAISFGNNTLVSWECLIMDSDHHLVINRNDDTVKDNKIVIGNHVWVGCRCTILKGVAISDGCIIGACSNVVKSSEKERCLIVGNPARQIMDDVDWKE